MALQEGDWMMLEMLVVQLTKEELAVMAAVALPVGRALTLVSAGCPLAGRSTLRSSG